MRVEARFRESVQRFPDKTMLVAGGRRLTYAAVDAQSDSLAAALVKAGIEPGARIVFLLDNDAEAVTSFLAAWKAGAVACPLYPSMKAEKLAIILANTEPAAIIVHARYLPAVDAAVAAAGIAVVTIATQVPADAEHAAIRFEDVIKDGAATLPALSDTEALGLLIHTSGSTGRPKGVMLSQANIDAACQSIIGYLDNKPEDVVLSVLPLSFGYGITQMVTMASVGGTLVLEKSFAFPHKILERLAEEKVTGFPLVPTMAAMISGMKDLIPGFLPDLRYITSAAAALPPAISKRLQELLPATEIFVMYGQTECFRISFLAPAELAGRPISVGKAIPGTRAFVIDESGKPAAPGVIGELVVEGPHVMCGYWRDEVNSRRALETTEHGRRLRTGDLFRADENGFLHFVSRKDDIIKTRGEKVSPQEVERVLYSIDGVREAAVAGIDDPIFGQVVRAYVALEPGAALTDKDIIRRCASQLEDYMVPKSVEFRDALPRTTTGKIRLSAAADTEPQPENAA